MRPIRNIATRLFPTRHAPLALLCITAWLIALSLTQYPAEEWAGVVVLAYLLTWAAGLVVLATLKLAFRWLYGFGRSVRERLGGEVKGDGELPRIGQIIVMLVLIAIGSAPVGLAAVITTYAVGHLGFPPMTTAIELAGLSILIYSSAVILLFFGSSVAILGSVSLYLRQRRTVTSHASVPVSRQRIVPKVYLMERRRALREVIQEEQQPLSELIVDLPAVARARG